MISLRTSNVIVLGLATKHDGTLSLANDGKPYTTLTYNNGPGFYDHRTSNNGTFKYQDEHLRKNLTNTNVTGKNLLKIIFLFIII